MLVDMRLATLWIEIEADLHQALYSIASRVGKPG
jgi:hypothetical protein